MIYAEKRNRVLDALQPNTFRMSLPKAIMIATEMMMIANDSTSQKHEISKKTQNKKCWVLKQNRKTM